MLMLNADPISNWYLVPVLTGLLSVTQASKENVKLSLIASLKNCCYSAEATRLGIYR